MNSKDLQDQLTVIFSEDVFQKTSRARLLKSKIFLEIDELEHHKVTEQLISCLTSYYKSPPEGKESALKMKVMNAIRSEEEHVSQGYFRRLSAAALAFVFMFSIFLGPLELLSAPSLLPSAQALMVKCSGSVFVNKKVCTPLLYQSLLPGDTLLTLDGVAEILYPNSVLVRTQSFSELTLGDRGDQSLFLSNGNVWVVAPHENEGIQIITPVSDNHISKGSAGISATPQSSQIISTTAAVQVQYDRKDSVELITLPPQKEITIKKTNVLTRVRQEGIQQEDKWILDNVGKDEKYLAQLKDDASLVQQKVAGVLPGGVRDYVSKVSQSARMALTWNEESRIDLKLGELGELLAESLVLLEDLDLDRSNTTFLNYQEKWTSLLDQQSVSLGQDRSKSLAKIDDTLREQLKILSLFGPEDPAYVYKSELEQMVLTYKDLLSLDDQRDNVDEVVNVRILDAHKSAGDGNIRMAKQILEKTMRADELSFQNHLPEIDTADITLLDDLAEVSHELKPLVEEMKKQSVADIKSQESLIEKSLLKSRHITGTAYQLSQEDVPETRKTRKIVGQAVIDSK